MQSSRNRFSGDWKKELEEEEQLTPEEVKQAEADRREEEEIMRDLEELEWEREMAEDMRLMRLMDEEDALAREIRQGEKEIDRLHAEEEFRQRMVDALEPFDLD